MFLITYKKGLNSEKSKIEFDQPVTFFKANEMLIEAVTRYKQTGQTMKISYKIVEIESGESVFNSKILIDRDIPSLFQLIKENSHAPNTVIDYVAKVENREVIEAEQTFSFNNHIEERAHLEELKSEKNEILQQLKKQEKERQQRDIEHQKKMKEIQDEKQGLEKSIQLKEKEEAVKESQRIEALRLLEEEKRKAIQQMEEKQALDKQKKEEHEKRLKEVEDEARKAEIELSTITTELEKIDLERKKELQELEEKKLEADRKVSVLKAEGDKDEVKHRQELIDYKDHTELDEPSPLPIDNYQTTMVMPKVTLKEKLQELDFEAVKGLSIRFVKVSAKGLIKGTKKAYWLLKNYRDKDGVGKQEKLKVLNNEVDIEEKLVLAKIDFMEELKKERLKQEKEIRKEARQKEKEVIQQSKIEERYRAVKKKRISRYPLYGSNSIKFIFGFVIITLVSIYYTDLGNTVPILNDVKSYMENFVSMISNATQRS